MKETRIAVLLAAGILAGAGVVGAQQQPQDPQEKPNQNELMHRARFAQADSNRDGLLSRSELTAINDDSLDFATLDGDRSGTISDQEWSLQLPGARTAAAADEE